MSTKGIGNKDYPSLAVKIFATSLLLLVSSGGLFHGGVQAVAVPPEGGGGRRKETVTPTDTAGKRMEPIDHAVLIE